MGESIVAIPGLDDGYMPYNYAIATSSRTYSGWVDGADVRHDWSVITLDRRIGNFTGWMGRLTAAPTNALYSGPLNVAGYPADKGSVTMWFDADTGDHADEYNHAYFMDTEGGQSGAPVWVYDGTDRFTTTVHTYGLASAGRNLGTRLNQEKFDRLTTWINGDALPNDRPDLIDDGQAFSTFSPTVVTQGATSFSTSNAVRNIGTASSGPFCVSYYASTDTTITPLDFFIGSSCDNAPLAPFGVQSFTWSGTFPGNIPAGTYWVGWIIDGTNAINEFDDTNNVAYKTSSQLTVHAVAGGSIALGAAILPGSRAVQVNHTATAFATILATGTGTATGCAITPTNAPAGTAFSYQQTNASNVPIGTPNTPPRSRPAGSRRSSSLSRPVCRFRRPIFASASTARIRRLPLTHPA